MPLPYLYKKETLPKSLALWTKDADRYRLSSFGSKPFFSVNIDTRQLRSMKASLSLGTIDDEEATEGDGGVEKNQEHWARGPAMPSNIHNIVNSIVCINICICVSGFC